MEYKTCNTCGINKPLQKYNKDSKRISGLRDDCNLCSRKRYGSYVRTPDGLAARIYSDQKGSSINRHHPSPVYSVNELRAWMKAQVNFDALFSSWVQSNYNKLLSPSCDRLDDYKPYTLDNLQLMTWGDNKLKGEADSLNGVNNKKNKPVIQLKITGEFIAEYYSMQHAARSTGCEQGAISYCCSGKYKTTGGFAWEYKLYEDIRYENS